MKDLNLSEIELPFKISMLRAYGQEPILRYMARRNDDSVMIINENGFEAWNAGRKIRQWIGWPKKDLFDYDEAVYMQLRSLYEEGRIRELNDEWMKLTPLK